VIEHDATLLHASAKLCALIGQVNRENLKYRHYRAKNLCSCCVWPNIRERNAKPQAA
jgi:hypothetical protein